ncbi:MAG TPA: hypothetical protein VFQ35_00785, partial [Polyangiaceae bacterium]|nr:hypothetical protein [Polyangiaceae bacterium]
TPCVSSDPPRKTYAWLAESPKPRAKPTASARAVSSAVRVERRPPDDAGTKAALPDAGATSAPAREDAGAEPETSP